jgi:hypothetical protein
VRSQNRALFGFRVVQLDQEPLARIVVSQLFQSTVHIVAPLALPYPHGPVRATFVRPRYAEYNNKFTLENGT